MLIQSSLPSSIEAPLSFLSEHGKQDFLCDWMPAAETWQMYSKCDKHPQGGCRKAVPITEGRKNDDDSCSLNFPKSCSQLSTISVMSEVLYLILYISEGSSERSTPPFFQPRHQQTQRQVLVAFLLEPRHNLLIDVLLGKSMVLMMHLKNSMSKVNEFYSANDSCSSSKSNMELGSASMKNDVDDTAECSSSSVLGMATMGEDISEKDLCISVLRSEGLLRVCLPSRSCPTDGVSYDSDSRGSRTCKVCANQKSH
ncbi:hypothetical protein CK203_074280 [Vitis vinifera]|uniref:Uncharacterized protein n=1 Tax=Vitis vinifera TaxID=29760 RepID=A0A438BYV8_VITVI|nr:hypothetical protein CK203_074280 [Vitis vinifera]